MRVLLTMLNIIVLTAFFFSNLSIGSSTTAIIRTENEKEIKRPDTRASVRDVDVHFSSDAETNACDVTMFNSNSITDRKH